MRHWETELENGWIVGVSVIDTDHDPTVFTSEGADDFAERLNNAQRAVSLAEVCEFLRAATYPDPACGGTRHVSGWQSAAVALEREFGGRT
jgi:hypothetical protein